MLKATPNRSLPAGLLFRDACAIYSSESALIYEGQSWTFERLWRECAQAASALVRTGIGPASCVASWSPNAAEALIAQWGAILVGSRTVHLDPDWETSQAREALKGVEIDCLFVRAFYEGRQYPAMVKAIRAECPGLGPVVTHGRVPRFERSLRGGWLDFLDTGDASGWTTNVVTEPIVTFFREAELDASSDERAGAYFSDDVRRNVAKRPICVAVPCWQPLGLSMLLHAHLCGRTVVLMGERCDPQQIREVAQQANCELALITPANARPPYATGSDDDRKQLRWITQTPRLADEMNTIARDMGLTFHTALINANLG
jgi:hypothetical protein